MTKKRMALIPVLVVIGSNPCSSIDAGESSTIKVNPLREAYYGDLHLHTTYSYDVYVSANLTPDDAYKFARGESVNFLGEEVRRSTPPLDFLAVTDHCENMGVFNALDDPQSAVAQSPFGLQIKREGLKALGKAFVRLWYPSGEKNLLSSVADVAPQAVQDTMKTAWQREIKAANRNYQPGRFTTFIGYEWTSAPGMQNLHRVVLFQGDSAPEPFTSADSTRPEDLWGYLERIRKQGYVGLAIPHNANASNGLMFDSVDSNGRPIDRAYAALRAAHEPLFEIVQEKGQSETHPMLSSNDEFANFEVLDFTQGFRKGHPSKLEGSYVRDALGRGMEISRRIGVNPFKYGFVGDSDIHTGMSESSERVSAENYMKAKARELSTSVKEWREGVAEQLNPNLPSDAANYANEYGGGSAGLTGVWAQSNTRESVFAALRRKETFATSGTRLKFRFFGGWEYSRNLLENQNWIRAAYRDGVPMGGDLPPKPAGERTPTFAIWAVKDPDGANLDRLQVVKVWLQSGKHVERIYDVALSNGRKVDPKTRHAKAVGSTVDLKTAKYTNTIGATELSAIWRDEDFNPTVPAAYYLRVLEIPTPRWSTMASVERGEPLPKKVPATIQERGWSSPIWFLPTRHVAEP